MFWTHPKEKEGAVTLVGSSVLEHPFSRHNSRCFLFFAHLDLCEKLFRYFDLNRWFVKNVAVVSLDRRGEDLCVCVFIHRFTQRQKSLDS